MKILLVINKDFKLEDVKLKFQEMETGKLEEIFSKKTILNIKNGESDIGIDCVSDLPEVYS